MSKLIYVVDDESNIRTMMQLFLENEGFTVETFKDGQEACQAFSAKEPDMLILDIMMPGIDGLSLCTYFRRQSHVPIIFVSAKDTPLDRVMGITLGSDDYITKPFSVAEVLARIKANIRRTTQYDNTSVTAPAILAAGDLVMSLSDYSITKKGKNIELTAKEFDILKLLLQNPKKVYTKEQIYSLVWNDAYLGDENAVNVHISRLRNKIEDDTRNPRYILTVWGIGYKLGDTL